MESDLRDRARAGSSLRHWPPGTNRKRSCRLFLLRTRLWIRPHLSLFRHRVFVCSSPAPQQVLTYIQVAIHHLIEQAFSGWRCASACFASCQWRSKMKAREHLTMRLPNHRLLVGLAVFVATAASYAQWSNPAAEVPAYHPAAPLKVSALPPML